MRQDVHRGEIVAVVVAEPAQRKFDSGKKDGAKNKISTYILCLIPHLYFGRPQTNKQIATRDAHKTERKDLHPPA